MSDDCLAMVDLFFHGLDQAAFAAGTSGLAAQRFLPDDGAMNDQAACIADAFDIISQVVRGLRKRM